MHALLIANVKSYNKTLFVLDPYKAGKQFIICLNWANFELIWVIFRYIWATFTCHRDFWAVFKPNWATFWAKIESLTFEYIYIPEACRLRLRSLTHRSVKKSVNDFGVIYHYDVITSGFCANSKNYYMYVL